MSQLLGVQRKALPALRDGLVAVLLGLTITSLIFGWSPAAGSDPGNPHQATPSDEKLWNQRLSEDQKIVHLLNRITFGPRPGDVERVGEMGLKKFLDEQLHPERISDAAVEAKLAALPTLTMKTEELMEKFPQPKPAAKPKEVPKSSTAGAAAQPVSAKADLPKPAPPPRPSVETLPGPQRVMSELAREELWRAVYSDRQLQEVTVQFWMNHFNIFAPKGADRWMLTSFERDVIRPRALGKFEDLLVATAESPAMLFYLDNWMSRAPAGAPGPPPAVLASRGKPRRGRFYGVMFGGGPPANHRKRAPANTATQQAKPPGRGAGLNENYGREIMELHTLGVDGGYTQKDVVEVSRCFTGWTIEKPQQSGAFKFEPKMHDYGEKVVLGHKIRTGRGIEDALEVMRILAQHPSTARFISLKLCRRFVADEPPESVVDRGAKTFLKTHGDIRKVLKTILTSPEFYSEAAFRSKVKSPLELVASSLRALGGDTDADLPILQAIQRMGQAMFQYEAPTGFPDRAVTWINSGTLLTRMNFGMTLATNGVPGTAVKLDAFARDDARPNAVVDGLAQEMLGGVVAPQTREAILKKIAETSPTGESSPAPSAYVPAIAGMLISSPEFQRR